MKLRFTSFIDINEYRRREIYKNENIVLLSHKSADRPRILKELEKIFDLTERNVLQGKDPIMLDVTIDIQYRPRSIDANNLMWALYTVIAEVMNRELRSMKKITPQELYDEDMKDIAPRRRIMCSRDDEQYFIEVLQSDFGGVKSRTELSGNIVLEAWETSSRWNTKQMSEHIERLIATLEDMGVTTAGNGDVNAIFNDYQKWRADKNDSDTEGKPE